MKVRLGLLNKLSSLDTPQFQNYWLQNHGPLVRSGLSNLREYWQNHVVDRQQRGIDFARGPWNFDGFSQLWFDDSASAHHAFNDGSFAAALIADEAKFIDQLLIVTAEQQVVIPLPEDPQRARLLKRISTLRRPDGMSEADFRHEWCVHGEFVKKMPGVSAYRQNVIIERERVKGTPCDYKELPMDGIVELWFESEETLETAFSSEAGQRTMAHAKTFLSEITAFLVKEHRIV
ncbi:MAG: EthD domain-containing protein [Polaromonas sp.]|uniref:EthD domain-containing protein n=1 Tax=Polaromonas sp. TaxID=1869339 RepID=UPI002489F530|nr:EthD domain-containing protein [Polaromonas sp.]MDI1269946.1 EthD domain-containing protein [Polaromonas sp.]